MWGESINNLMIISNKRHIIKGENQHTFSKTLNICDITGVGHYKGLERQTSKSIFVSPCVHIAFDLYLPVLFPVLFPVLPLCYLVCDSAATIEKWRIISGNFSLLISCVWVCAWTCDSPDCLQSPGGSDPAISGLGLHQRGLCVFSRCSQHQGLSLLCC